MIVCCCLLPRAAGEGNGLGVRGLAARRQQLRHEGGAGVPASGQREGRVRGPAGLHLRQPHQRGREASVRRLRAARAARREGKVLRRDVKVRV